ncbi:hypothetical protein [Streptomyces sp. NPDC001401]|uniref:hypothetical protein n=1 Tax=Streptomyces sp. NPDC001401 TaxID=3364570 RepID=UPI0036C073AA
MSTEAQHASIPPRPPQPPTVGPLPSESRAGTGPAAQPDAATPSGRTPDTQASGGVWSPWRGSEPFEAFGHRTPAMGSNAEAGPESPAENEPAPAAQSRPGTGSGALPPSRGGGARGEGWSSWDGGDAEGGWSSGRQPQPGAVSSSGRGPGSDADSARRPGSDSSAGSAAANSSQPQPHSPSPSVPFARDAGPQTPPPPQATARFPDTPPAAGREEERGSGGTTPPGTAVPPRPSHRPAPSLGRTNAPAETAQETTTRLRPIPPAETPARPTTVPGTGRTSAPADPRVRPVPQPPNAPAGSAGRPVPSAPASADPPRRPESAAGPMPPARAASGSGPAVPPTPDASAGKATPASAPAEPPRRPDATAGPMPPARPVTPPMPSTRPSSPQVSQSPPMPPTPGSRVETAGAGPDPALSWSAPTVPGGTQGTRRPVVSFGEPEGYDERVRPRPLGDRVRSRTAAVAACVVLGLGLIGGAMTGSWLVGGSGDEGGQDTFAEAGSLWHSVPVDQLFPRTVQGTGAGPGGADRTWTRIAVAPDSGCKDAFDPLLKKALAPVGCQRLLRATYTDATQSFVTTVGLLFTEADTASMESLAKRFQSQGLGTRTDLMPRPYAAKNTAAAHFGTKQRASWTVSVLTDAPVVVYAVSGWADGRTVDTPLSAEQAIQSGATSAPAQAGLGNEAQGLADRIERALRKDVTSPTENPS